MFMRCSQRADREECDPYHAYARINTFVPERVCLSKTDYQHESKRIEKIVSISRRRRRFQPSDNSKSEDLPTVYFSVLFHRDLSPNFWFLHSRQLVVDDSHRHSKSPSQISSLLPCRLTHSQISRNNPSPYSDASPIANFRKIPEPKTLSLADINQKRLQSFYQFIRVQHHSKINKTNPPWPHSLSCLPDINGPPIHLNYVGFACDHIALIIIPPNPSQTRALLFLLVASPNCSL